MADDKHKVLHLIKDLVCRLETIPTLDPTCFPSFLCEKKPRYQPDWDKVPLITHSSVYEIRPTHEMKLMKTTGYGPDVTFIRYNSVHNPHASPPWYHPKDPKFLKEKAQRETALEDIWPKDDMINLCQMPLPNVAAKIPGEKELECTCDERYKDVRLCQWKEGPYLTNDEKGERYVCASKK